MTQIRTLDDIRTAEDQDRFNAAMHFCDGLNGSIQRAAYQYQVSADLLMAQLDERYRQWAASRGYDF
jgi:hypothetical protein